jgi:ABC-2 type transport system ATP-binding protein
MLEISRLSKQFGALVAVDDVSFTVPAGEVLGFLGPNGAGKSTTMKMISGFLAPTSGTAIICGHDILREPLRAKRRIGYLPEGAPAYPDMSAAEFLDFIAHIRGFRGAEARQRIAHIAELINIAEVMDQPIETLSKGYRRRVGVAQALLHDPDVVILDEPTDGLDPNQKHEMRGIIQRMSPEKAIIISTHLLEEVEAVCSRAIIIAQGRVLADGTPTELAARSRHHNAVRVGLPPAGTQPTIAAELARLPGVASIERASDGEGDGLWLFPRGRRPIVTEVAGLIRARGWLDDVFRTITTAPPATPGPTDEAPC